LRGAGEGCAIDEIRLLVLVGTAGKGRTGTVVESRRIGRVALRGIIVRSRGRGGGGV
jgi:hypothetical protein